MESATVHTAAQTTGWSVRMLHYLDSAGLVIPPRSPAGYRLYGAQEIAHLRELRQLLADHDMRPADLQVALRLRSEPALRHAVDGWLDASAAPKTSEPTTARTDDPAGPTPSMAPDQSTSWLSFEQDKHSRALQTNTAPSKENE